MPSRSLGQHLASRLVEVGVEDYFAVPGDYNLVLLDELLKEERLRMINTCNELNAGYAADGYARQKGVGCCVVTFTVGSLSIINAIAGAYSEDLPVICIVGGPNSNDRGSNRILHHTTGLPDWGQEERCFKEVTCAQVVVKDLEDAHWQIDQAISTAVQKSKPVYISICCNIAGEPYPTFDNLPVPFHIDRPVTNTMSLEAAVDAAAAFINNAAKPVLVAGPCLRVAGAQQAFRELADAIGCPVAIMPNAKGQFTEEHPKFIGTYWGQVSTPYCAEVVESADCYLFAGPVFNDYTSVGYSLLMKNSKMVRVDVRRVTVAAAQVFGCINMADFLSALARRVERNTTAYDNYERMFLPPGEVPRSPTGSPLRTNVLYKHVQGTLSPATAVLAETGDSWFNCQKLRLPQGCGYEFQMQYGSIGWSVGALLGMAAALQRRGRRVIASIGDGSFQVTAQEISTVIRYGFNPIVFLVNNAGYTIEVEIHDGPYNNIKGWDYVGLVNAFHNGEGKAYAVRVTTEEELEAAIEVAQGEKADSLVFIECIINRDDCSKELLEWGSRVAAANSRPPNTQ